MANDFLEMSLCESGNSCRRIMPTGLCGFEDYANTEDDNTNNFWFSGSQASLRNSSTTWLLPFFVKIVVILACDEAVS